MSELPEPVVAQPRWITPAELAAGSAAAPLLVADGRVDEPLIVVDLAAEPDLSTLRGAVSAASASDRILVGVAGVAGPAAGTAPLMAALDLSLVAAGGLSSCEVVGVGDPVAEAAELHRAVTAHPQASTVLSAVLRTTDQLPVPAALDVESLAYSTLLGSPEFQAWLGARGPRPAPPPAPNEPVAVERAGDVLHVTLNRPERRNAYGREVRDALVAALQLAVLDGSVEQVVLAGAGPSFCSGGDLDEFGTTPDLVTAHLIRTRAGAGLLIHRLADRTEARVHGACVGAGSELPAFAGRVIADPEAMFRLPEISMGLIPGAGGTVSISRRIGRWRTLHLALSGQPLSAESARQWGLVDEIAPSVTG